MQRSVTYFPIVPAVAPLPTSTLRPVPSTLTATLPTACPRRLRPLQRTPSTSDPPRPPLRTAAIHNAAPPPPPPSSTPQRPLSGSMSNLSLSASKKWNSTSDFRDQSPGPRYERRLLFLDFIVNISFFPSQAFQRWFHAVSSFPLRIPAEPFRPKLLQARVRTRLWRIVYLCFA